MWEKCGVKLFIHWVLDVTLPVIHTAINDFLLFLTRAHTHTDWLTRPVAAERDNWYWLQSSGKPASSPSSASCLGGRRKRCSFYSGPLSSLYCSCQPKQLCSYGGWILFFSLHFLKGWQCVCVGVWWKSCPMQTVKWILSRAKYFLKSASLCVFLFFSVS